MNELPRDNDTAISQRIITYLRFTEATRGSQATEEQANALADASKQGWWRENKHRFVR